MTRWPPRRALIHVGGLAVAWLLTGCDAMPNTEPAPQIAHVDRLHVVDLNQETGYDLRLPGGPARLALRLDIMTATPLRPFLAEVRRQLQARASWCEKQRYDARRRVLTTDVFDSRGRVTSDEVTLSQADMPLHAHLYLPLTASNVNGRHVLWPRALGADADSPSAGMPHICLQLVTVTKPFGGATSNSVRIPHADIRAALDAAGL